MLLPCVIFVLISFLSLGNTSEHDSDVVAIKIGKSGTDAFKRFLRSANVYDFDIKVLDKEESSGCHIDEGYCRRNDMSELESASGFSSLKKELEKYKQNQNQIVLVTNSDNLIFAAGEEDLIENFKTSEARVLFASDSVCDFEESLKSKFPEAEKGKRYLSSDGFIGYASDLYTIITTKDIKHTGDNQLFFSEVYLNDDLREKHHIQIDHTSQVFQTLNQEDEFQIQYEDNKSYLKNVHTDSIPSVVIGSKHNSSLIDIVGDYLANSYNPEDGCKQCLDNTISLEKLDEDKFPTVLVAITIPRATPFFEEFLEHLGELDYPKKKLHLYIHLGHGYNRKKLEAYLKSNGKQYASVHFNGLQKDKKEWQAKTEAVKLCLEKNCDYYFNMDPTAHLTNSQVLRHLIEQNRSVVSPFLPRHYIDGDFSNFWRSITADGQREDGFDYAGIFSERIKGLWTVPYVSSAYLINSTLLKSDENPPHFFDSSVDADMAFSRNMRENNVFLYVSNRESFGYLVSAENFNTSHLHNEMYNIFDNPYSWDLRYISKDFIKQLNESFKSEEPCPDVYWFPVFTTRFCKEMIEIAEDYGQWSGAKHEDARLSTGYEPYPTDDIHLKQIGLLDHWHEIMKQYISPLQKKVYPFHGSYPPESRINFVARYSQDRLKNLDAHDDASTYTINAALNRPGIDYQGGGVRFIRYNCTVTALKPGWLLMHPGQLTHTHEGLETTGGLRYIMVSFIDPN